MQLVRIFCTVLLIGRISVICMRRKHKRGILAKQNVPSMKSGRKGNFASEVVSGALREKHLENIPMLGGDCGVSKEVVSGPSTHGAGYRF